MQQCDQCDGEIEQGEGRDHRGQTLCEDCYMDALSPARTCDPWAVHSAKSFKNHTGSQPVLNDTQTEILGILKETGGIDKQLLLEQFHGRLSLSELEREFAALRHMERARAEKRGEKIILRVW